MKRYECSDLLNITATFERTFAPSIKKEINEVEFRGLAVTMQDLFDDFCIEQGLDKIDILGYMVFDRDGAYVLDGCYNVLEVFIDGEDIGLRGIKMLDNGVMIAEGYLMNDNSEPTEEERYFRVN